MNDNVKKLNIIDKDLLIKSCKSLGLKNEANSNDLLKKYIDLVDISLPIEDCRVNFLKLLEAQFNVLSSKRKYDYTVDTINLNLDDYDISRRGIDIAKSGLNFCKDFKVYDNHCLYTSDSNNSLRYDDILKEISMAIDFKKDIDALHYDEFKDFH